MRFSTAAYLFLCLTALYSCNSGDDNQKSETPFALVTFNTGLAPNLNALVTERAPEVFKAVSKLEADVVCLQEVWLEEDANSAIAAAKKGFPYFYRYMPEDLGGDDAAACTQEQLAPVQQCLETNCSQAEVLADCALANCEDEVSALSSNCLGCLVANLNLETEAIFQACSQGSGQYVYNGSNGLVLLSKVAMKNTSNLLFDSTGAKRAVLAATVNESGGPLHVFCTHLTSMEDIPYTGVFGSWEDEIAAEIDATETFVKEKAGGGGATIVMGDMNCGPEIAPNITAEAGAAYEKFIDLGYTDPYLDQSSPRCTFCASNQMAANDTTSDDQGNHIIDHILLRNLDDRLASTESARILDQTFEVQVDSASVKTNLSDHFGIRVTLNLR